MEEIDMADWDDGLTGKVKDKLGDTAAQAARTAVEANVDQVADTIESRYGAVLDPAQRYVAFVRARPVSAMLIAASTGFLLAKI
jgi:ElaB/YqjD/DUF883 family membrane-anchored ribosome-binding protein